MIFLNIGEFGQQPRKPFFSEEDVNEDKFLEHLIY